MEATCKGSYALGTACGSCSRCREELRKRSSSKLTDWEVANHLVAISDYMGDESRDFKESHPEVYATVQAARKLVRDKFNEMKTHGFGI